MTIQEKTLQEIKNIVIKAYKKRINTGNFKMLYKDILRILKKSEQKGYYDSIIEDAAKLVMELKKKFYGDKEINLEKIVGTLLSIEKTKAHNYISDYISNPVELPKAEDKVIEDPTTIASIIESSEYGVEYIINDENIIESIFENHSGKRLISEAKISEVLKKDYKDIKIKVYTNGNIGLIYKGNEIGKYPYKKEGDKIILDENTKEQMGITIEKIKRDETVAKPTETKEEGFINTVKNDSANSNVPIISFGSTGDYVKYLQSKLGIEQTGTFDSKTKGAVIEYQSKNGLTTDGIVGSKTWSKLLGFEVKTKIKAKSEVKQEVKTDVKPETNQEVKTENNDSKLVEEIKNWSKNRLFGTHTEMVAFEIFKKMKEQGIKLTPAIFDAYNNLKIADKHLFRDAYDMCSSKEHFGMVSDIILKSLNKEYIASMLNIAIGGGGTYEEILSKVESFLTKDKYPNLVNNIKTYYQERYNRNLYQDIVDDVNENEFTKLKETFK